MANYSWTTGTALPKAQAGDKLEGHNFHRMSPHTPLYKDIKGLRFVRCNLMNCDVPADAIVEDCLTGHVSHCSHLHPKWVGKGLPECSEQCVHVTGTDTILVDGEEISVTVHYADLEVL